MIGKTLQRFSVATSLKSSGAEIMRHQTAQSAVTFHPNLTAP
jgi:hypothetical protein